MTDSETEETIEELAERLVRRVQAWYPRPDRRVPRAVFSFPDIYQSEKLTRVVRVLRRLTNDLARGTVVRQFENARAVRHPRPFDVLSAFYDHTLPALEDIPRVRTAGKEMLAAVLEGAEGPVLEAMAAVEHDRWAKWYCWMPDHATPENVESWETWADLSYLALDESVKQQYRAQVQASLKAARDALDLFMAGAPDDPSPTSE